MSYKKHSHMRNNGDLETTVRYRIKISRYIMRYYRDTSISISTTLLYGKTPESGIPPRYRATRRYKKVHLELSLRFSTLISYRFSALDTGGTSGRGCSGWPSPLSGVPLSLPGGKKAKKADISSGHSHDRTAFESFAPDISR